MGAWAWADGQAATGTINMHFLAIVFVVVVAFMLVSARLRPARSRDAEPGAAPVDMTPWKHAKAMGVFVSVCSIGCYLLLAQ